MFNVVSFIRPCEQRCTCSCLGKERHYIISQGFRFTGCHDRSRYAQILHFIIQFSFYERSDWLKFVLINRKHKTLVKTQLLFVSRQATGGMLSNSICTLVPCACEEMPLTGMTMKNEMHGFPVWVASTKLVGVSLENLLCLLIT